MSSVTAVLAHGGASTDGGARSLVTALALAAVASAAAAYAVGLARLWRGAGTGRVVHRWQVASFVAGVVLLAFATAGPADALADASLSWHMTQHVVLVGVVAPALAVGALAPVALWALPERPRRPALAGWRRVRTWAAGERWPLLVAVALVAHVGALWAWHLPVLYDLAADEPWVHVVEHLAFVGTAAVLWWALLAGRARSRAGAGVVATFLQGLAGTGLGALMTLSGAVWYAHYDGGPDALQDQQVAGVVMWAVGGLAALVVAVGAFAWWLSAPDRLPEELRRQPAPDAGPVVG